MVSVDLKLSDKKNRTKGKKTERPAGGVLSQPSDTQFSSDYSCESQRGRAYARVCTESESFLSVTPL